jgi:hypothetical protein
MLKSVIAALTLLGVTSSFSEAAVRTYFQPQVNGARLDSCLIGKETCGKPTADAFCVAEGFTAALIFQREAAASTQKLGFDSVCEGLNCVSFKQIKCITSSKSGDLAQN